MCVLCRSTLYVQAMHVCDFLHVIHGECSARGLFVKINFPGWLKQDIAYMHVELLCDSLYVVVQVLMRVELLCD